MRLRGKIERHEGRESIGRLTADLQRTQATTTTTADEPTKSNVMETVDLTACLAAVPLATALLASTLGLPVV